MKTKIWTPDLEKHMVDKKLVLAAWSAVAIAAAYKAVRAARICGRAEAFLYDIKLSDLAGVSDAINEFIDNHVKQ